MAQDHSLMKQLSTYVPEEATVVGGKLVETVDKNDIHFIFQLVQTLMLLLWCYLLS